MTRSIRANSLIVCWYVLGCATWLYGAAHWDIPDHLRFFCFFVLAIASSGMKVVLPGIDSTMSVAFLFALLGIVELNFPETLVVISCSVLVQSVWRVKKFPSAIQITFNAANVGIATLLADRVYHLNFLVQAGLNTPLRLLLSCVTYFLAQTCPVATIIGATEGKRLGKTWHQCYFWSFPYYLLGAAIAAVFNAADRAFGWQATMLGLPVVFVIYRSYRLYLGKLEEEKKYAENQKQHADDMASLHLRTIEALALAIEAKDQTTHRHLERVQVYAVEVGRSMGLSEVEIEALRAGALLHDIGKLAVPEHIISKPGKLTIEEFDKMKIHPVVGAEILERVQFPYPVVPIVRSHHEKWDGSGYPDGLKGEQIPIGARILAAADCLDALASERQYRRALPLDAAMEIVVLEAGKSYDPAVVKILRERYRELEAMAVGRQVEPKKLSKNLKIENGRAPAAGFEVSGSARAQPSDFLQSIAAARAEVQTLFEMSQDLGNSLSLNETLSVLEVKLRRIIPHDAIAIYIVREKVLKPEYVSGDDFRLFSSLSIPIGQGLSGWVAENRQPIVNGNPSVEPGYLNDPNKFSILRSALAVPLEGLNGVVGVLTLYHVEKDAFIKDHLRILMALSSKLSLSIENALKYQQASSSATTDYVTGLPNARSLFLHLDAEVARCKRDAISLAVLVCDLDGFKQVNDRLGHLEGNRALEAVAAEFKAQCREYDYVARMGGDEFVLIIPGIGPEAAPARMERLRQSVTQISRRLWGQEILAVSIGSAFFGLDGQNAERLLAEADRRMYTEKATHRTQCTPAGIANLEMATNVEHLDAVL